MNEWIIMRDRLILCCATMESQEKEYPGEIKTWVDLASRYFLATTSIIFNTPERNLGVVGSYEQFYQTIPEEYQILVFAHDDVVMREEGWDERIRQEFRDPSVGIVGMGGALSHGSPNLYKRPYYLPALGRTSYLSNVDDAEVHGKRFTGATDVAVLDGFVLACRRSFLDRCGGFTLLQKIGVDFIAYDYAMCALAHRYGYRVRVVGCRCHHYGGRTSVNVGVHQEDYDRAHKAFYEEFRDVMPWSCE